jgi:hypothetical protein
VEGVGDFKVRGHIIISVKYADDFVLLAKIETLIQEMTNTPIETGRCYRMEMNEDKTKVMRIPRHISPV